MSKPVVNDPTLDENGEPFEHSTIPEVSDGNRD